MEVKCSTVSHLAIAAALPDFLLLLSHNASPQQKKKLGQKGKIGWFNRIFIMIMGFLYVLKYEVHLSYS